MVRLPLDEPDVPQASNSAPALSAATADASRKLRRLIAGLSSANSSFWVVIEHPSLVKDSERRAVRKHRASCSNVASLSQDISPQGLEWRACWIHFRAESLHSGVMKTGWTPPP